MRPTCSDAIMAQIENLPEPPPPLFNGATRLLLSVDVRDVLVPLMTTIDRRRIAVETRALLTHGYGVGFRSTVEGDPEWQIVPDYGTLVWTCGPKTQSEK